MVEAVYVENCWEVGSEGEEVQWNKDNDDDDDDDSSSSSSSNIVKVGN